MCSSWPYLHPPPYTHTHTHTHTLLTRLAYTADPYYLLISQASLLLWLTHRCARKHHPNLTGQPPPPPPHLNQTKWLKCSYQFRDWLLAKMTHFVQIVFKLENHCFRSLYFYLCSASLLSGKNESKSDKLLLTVCLAKMRANLTSCS